VHDFIRTTEETGMMEQFISGGCDLIKEMVEQCIDDQELKDKLSAFPKEEMKRIVFESIKPKEGGFNCLTHPRRRTSSYEKKKLPRRSKFRPKVSAECSAVAEYSSVTEYSFRFFSG
jgi:hypothetical protein